MLLPLASTAAVYKCKGADGSTVFADAPCGPDAQVQAVKTPPPISDTPAPATGVGGRSTQRDEASACWVSKYNDWRTRNPQLAAKPDVNLDKVQQLEKECHWTPRTHGAAGALSQDRGSQATRPMPSAAAVAAQAPASGAAGGIDAYLSDAHLLASRQAASPGVATRYSDPANGALLKSVLNPPRALSALDAALRQGNMRQFDELRHLLEPLQQRYAQAFAISPRTYEAEYLDTLDISASVVRLSIDRLRSASQAAPPPGASATASDARLDHGAASLNQSMSGLMTTLAQTMAKSIRQQVSGGKFSAAGAKRATGIADSLASG